MKEIFLLFVCLTISVVSFGQDKTASTPATPETPPGPSMEETEKWIKRELPKMGRDSIVQASGTLRVERNYEITKATLTDCTLKLQSVSQWVITANPQSETATVTMKDLDLSRLVAVEASPFGGRTASKPSYVVRLVAQSDPNMPLPFTSLLTGYKGGPTTGSVDAVNVRVRDMASANQVAGVFRRAAVLCGAPDRPVDLARLVSCEDTGYQMFCLPPKVASGPTESVTAKPTGNSKSTMTNDDVVQLVTAGLSEQVIITSIRQAPTKDFDLTPTGLIALKKASVPDAVIVVMQEKATPERAPSANEAKASSKYDPTLAEAPKPTSAPAPQDSCSGIESMGVFKNTVMDPAIGGGVVEWLAKIRNNTNVTKIVVFGWIDMYGQQKKAQVQIRGGDIASVRLDLTQARVIPPVRDVRVLSCQ